MKKIWQFLWKIEIPQITGTVFIFVILITYNAVIFTPLQFPDPNYYQNIWTEYLFILIPSVIISIIVATIVITNIFSHFKRLNLINKLNRRGGCIILDKSRL